MLYRPIGNTGMSASVIGLGAEHLDNKPYSQVEETIKAALSVGINIIDVFMPGTPVRENIATALGSNRKDVYLQGHIGSVDLNQQYDISRDVEVCEKYFESLLRSFKTDYIDLGMMFFIDTDKDFKDVFETEYLDYVQKLKQQGKIRAIGASSHNPEIAQKIVRTGLIDVLMFSINMAFDMTPADINVLSALESGFQSDHFKGMDSKRSELYKLCESLGVSITVMKTLGAGKLLSAEHSPFEKPMTVGQCIHYALTRPAVVSALLGCQNESEVMEAVRYLTMSDAEKDYSLVAQSFKGSFQGNCVYCNHCLPCPSNIDIAALTKYLDIARLDRKNIPPSIRQHYGALEHKASECIKCKSCEKRCPFGVPIIENMTLAQEFFGV